MRLTLLLLAVFLPPLVAAPLRTAPEKASHPLDPLTAAEFGVLREVAAKEFGADKTVCGWAQLNEPPKEEVLAFRPGQPFRREALAAFLVPARKTAYEVVVDLRGRKLVSCKDLGNLQPFVTNYDHDVAVEVIDASPEVRAALEKRGYKLDGKKISERFLVDYYAPGDDPRLRRDGKTVRAQRILFADRQGGTNDYGPYVEGLMALVDVYDKKILALYDYPGPKSPENVPHDIYSRAVLGPKAPSSPLHLVSAPFGKGDLKVDGNHVAWGPWDFRYGFNQREGLVLYQIAHRDGDRLRSVCYRAAVSEMLVPYSEPAPEWVWREFFDVGEYGLGFCSNQINAGKELPTNAVTADAVFPEQDLSLSKDYGSRVCFYERDGGALFAHTQPDDGSRVYARGKELVVGFIATVGNYDYLYKWVFRQDGSFGFETELEGLILNKTVPPPTDCSLCRKEEGPGTYVTDEEPYGTLVSPQILGVFHQHWVSLRMDFDIDGTANAVKEVDTVGVPFDAAKNPRGRAFRLRQTVFGTAAEAERLVDPGANRCWVVYNPALQSPLGHHPGYAIVPQGNTTSCIPPYRWGGETSFSQRHFWVTPYKEGQLYAAGRYPNEAPADLHDNLAAYAKAGGSIYKADDVVWYSLGFTHITRPEDYPLMPAVHVGVDFVPDGFFLRSPAMGYAHPEPRGVPPTQE
ncbi:MAG: hypothetical protein PW734_08385 [Verrucomicrobium sp.]|nr:hypothetical protein [Verrucomicrobium sp.]